MKYQIQWVDPRREDWWKDAQTAPVNHFPWGGEDSFRPVTCARLRTNGEAFFVYMETSETELRAETRGFGHVHTDSCMEFFLSPDIRSERYLNWEFNSAGAMYLSIGTGRHDRIAIPRENYRELFQVKTAVHDRGWNLEYRIPFSFIREYFPTAELQAAYAMRGNFYKCGDLSPRPHFGCWSPINLPQPNFHCPEFFGEMIIGEA
jgi:hypothetical protein